MSTVLLCDGRMVDSASDAWKCECLARHLLNLPMQKRTQWLADLVEKHDKSAVNSLLNTMQELHESQKVHLTEPLSGGRQRPIDTTTEDRA